MESTVLVLLLLLLNVVLAEPDDAAELLETPPVWLTVSPLQDSASGVSQEAVINWRPGVEEVALFTADPRTNNTPDIRLRTESQPSGMYRTRLSLEGRPLPGGWAQEALGVPEPGDHCLGFWVASLKGGTLDHVNCLKIRPTWMSDNRLTIGHLPLTALLWPGTHNSGCYPGPGGHVISPALARFVYTQDQDVWTQLVFGVRYIDLRVGIYPTRTNGSQRIDLSRSFWVNHDLIKVRPLVPILRHIKEFLRKAEGELVVLDLHRFPVGFSGRHARHNRLVELLDQELREVAADFPGGWPSLDLLQPSGKRLIIAYGDIDVAKKHSWLWPPVRQQWGDRQTVAGLREFLEERLEDEEVRVPERGLWALMAQLTPGPSDLLFRPGQSLRTMAHAVNPRLASWVRGDPLWWRQANLIAADFFLGAAVVDVAVDANVRRGRNVTATHVHRR